MRIVCPRLNASIRIRTMRVSSRTSLNAQLEMLDRSAKWAATAPGLSCSPELRFIAFSAAEKWSADLPSREKRSKTQVPVLLRYSFGFMEARNDRKKRAIRYGSENNSLSCRLNGGGTDIRTLIRLFKKAKRERKSPLS
jgi:hypothetical protein